MSLGTVMTDSLCLPKVYGWSNRHWQRRFEAKREKQAPTKKQTAHVQSFEPHNKFSTEYQIICLPDVKIPSGDHQAIPLISSKSIYTPFMKEAAVSFICHVSHKQWGSVKG